jgi:hypothetical protein
MVRVAKPCCSSCSRVVVQSNLWPLRKQSPPTACCNKHKEMSLEWKSCSTHAYLLHVKLRRLDKTPKVSKIQGSHSGSRVATLAYLDMVCTIWL